MITGFITSVQKYSIAINRMDTTDKLTLCTIYVSACPIKARCVLISNKNTQDTSTIDKYVG